MLDKHALAKSISIITKMKKEHSHKLRAKKHFPRRILILFGLTMLVAVVSAWLFTRFFLPPAYASTEGWDTFSDTETGFSFDYPSNYTMIRTERNSHDGSPAAGVTLYEADTKIMKLLAEKPNPAKRLGPRDAVGVDGATGCTAEGKRERYAPITLICDKVRSDVGTFSLDWGDRQQIELSGTTYNGYSVSAELYVLETNQKKVFKSVLRSIKLNESSKQK